MLDTFYDCLIQLGNNVVLPKDNSNRTDSSLRGTATAGYNTTECSSSSYKMVDNTTNRNQWAAGRLLLLQVALADEDVHTSILTSIIHTQSIMKQLLTQLTTTKDNQKHMHSQSSPLFSLNDIDTADNDVMTSEDDITSSSRNNNKRESSNNTTNNNKRTNKSSSTATKASKTAAVTAKARKESNNMYRECMKELKEACLSVTSHVIKFLSITGVIIIPVASTSAASTTDASSLSTVIDSDTPLSSSPSTASSSYLVSFLSTESNRNLTTKLCVKSLATPSLFPVLYKGIKFTSFANIDGTVMANIDNNDGNISNNNSDNNQNNQATEVNTWLMAFIHDTLSKSLQPSILSKHSLDKSIEILDTLIELLLSSQSSSSSSSGVVEVVECFEVFNIPIPSNQTTTSDNNNSNNNSGSDNSNNNNNNNNGNNNSNIPCLLLQCYNICPRNVPECSDKQLEWRYVVVAVIAKLLEVYRQQQHMPPLLTVSSLSSTTLSLTTTVAKKSQDDVLILSDLFFAKFFSLYFTQINFIYSVLINESYGSDDDDSEEDAYCNKNKMKKMKKNINYSSQSSSQQVPQVSYELLSTLLDTLSTGLQIVSLKSSNESTSTGTINNSYNNHHSVSATAKTNSIIDCNENFNKQCNNSNSNQGNYNHHGYLFLQYFSQSLIQLLDESVSVSIHRIELICDEDYEILAIELHFIVTVVSLVLPFVSVHSSSNDNNSYSNNANTSNTSFSNQTVHSKNTVTTVSDATTINTTKLTTSTSVDIAKSDSDGNYSSGSGSGSSHESSLQSTLVAVMNAAINICTLWYTNQLQLIKENHRNRRYSSNDGNNNHDYTDSFMQQQGQEVVKLCQESLQSIAKNIDEKHENLNDKCSSTRVLCADILNSLLSSTGTGILSTQTAGGQISMTALGTSIIIEKVSLKVLKVQLKQTYLEMTHLFMERLTSFYDFRK